jgi:hypothetical protein
MKVIIIGGIIWLASAFLAWALCKAAGDADDRMGTRDE